MRTCFFIPSDILFAEQMSIERNNSVVVIFRHLLPLLPNLYFISCLSLIFLYVMSGLGVDSWRERAISEVRGLRDERGPTQLGIYTRTSMDPRNALRLPEDDRRKNNTVIAGLVFLFVIAGLDPAIQGFPGQTVE